jgi:predicted nucleotidyltransferase
MTGFTEDYPVSSRFLPTPSPFREKRAARPDSVSGRAAGWALSYNGPKYNMKRIIEKQLVELEKAEAIKILYACESGSRAWGFPSRDSDYDVRFLYVRPPDWYLSIKEKRDVVEIPIQGQLDVNGWDLSKALLLLSKSNPTLLEWIDSPIIYRQHLSFSTSLRKLALQYFSTRTSLHHYISMARTNYRLYLKGEEVWVKKYFYVLRPLLAVRWIEAEKGMVPTEFSALLKGLKLDSVLVKEVKQLLQAKRGGAELDYGPRIGPISDFIQSEVSRLEKATVHVRRTQNPLEPLDDFFRKTLAEVWSPERTSG